MLRPAQGRGVPGAAAGQEVEGPEEEEGGEEEDGEEEGVRPARVRCRAWAAGSRGAVGGAAAGGAEGGHPQGRLQVLAGAIRHRRQSGPSSLHSSSRATLLVQALAQLCLPSSL